MNTYLRFTKLLGVKKFCKGERIFKESPGGWILEECPAKK